MILVFWSLLQSFCKLQIGWDLSTIISYIKDELHKDRNNIFHYFLNDFYFKKSTFISRSPILATNSENNFQVTNFILHTSNKLPQYFPSVKSVWSYHLSFLRFFDFLKFRQRMEGYFKTTSKTKRTNEPQMARNRKPQLTWWFWIRFH